MKKIFLFLSLSICLVNCSSPEGFINQNIYVKDIIVAHRGAWKRNNLPQNSIASLRKAIEYNYAGSEFDVWITADDSLVVNHDPYYFGLLIEETKYDELLKYNLSNGEKIPTVLDFFKEKSKDSTSTRLFCEIKAIYKNSKRPQVAIEKLCNSIVELNLENDVTVSSFNLTVLEKLRSINGVIKCELLSEELDLNKLSAKNIDLNFNYQFYKNNPSIISEAKARKATVNVWTVNNTADMIYMINSGVDYINTDEPEILYKLLESKR